MSEMKRMEVLVLDQY